MKWLVIISFLALGCSEKVEIRTTPVVPIDHNQRWVVIAPYVKRHFETDMTVEEIATELSYAYYKLNKVEK